MFSKENLTKLFTKNFKKKLKESLIPSSQINKQEIINDLVNEIKSYSYHPNKPRDYIIFNKHNGVARIVPSFTAKDTFLYYICVKFIEDEIAQNRVEGTYGGWRLGNKIALMERKEEQELMIENYVVNSFNPFLWNKNWTDFQKKAALHAQNHSYMLFADIANFYDSINLNLLKRKVYLAIPREKYQVVELLFHFLENWNRTFEGYSRKNLGIPQDEFGDSSRLLANFYLQDFDKEIKELSERMNIKYLRYADDMIFYANDENSLKRILFEVSKLLYKIGLNINAGKIKFFNRQEFNTYWAFEIFEKIEEKQFNEAVEKFFEFKGKKREFREHSVLKKLLNIKDLAFIIDHRLKYKLYSEFFNEDFIVFLTPWHFSKIYNILDAPQKEEFVSKLKSLVDKVFFNSFHYSLLRFFKKERIDFATNNLNRRIEKLALR